MQCYHTLLTENMHEMLYDAGETSGIELPLFTGDMNACWSDVSAPRALYRSLRRHHFTSLHIATRKATWHNLCHVRLTKLVNDA